MAFLVDGQAFSAVVSGVESVNMHYLKFNTETGFYLHKTYSSYNGEDIYGQFPR